MRFTTLTTACFALFATTTMAFPPGWVTKWRTTVKVYFPSSVPDETVERAKIAAEKASTDIRSWFNVPMTGKCAQLCIHTCARHDCADCPPAVDHDKGFVAILSPYSKAMIIRAVGPDVPIAFAKDGALFYWSFCPEDFEPQCSIDAQRDIPKAASK